MTLSALIIFFVAEFVFAVTPGQSVAALVARVINRGWRSVLPFLAAMWIGEIIWLTCAVAGLSHIAQTFHEAFVVLKYLGVAYLFYLAYRMWTARIEEKEADSAKGRKTRAAVLCRAGGYAWQPEAHGFLHRVPALDH